MRTAQQLVNQMNFSRAYRVGYSKFMIQCIIHCCFLGVRGRESAAAGAEGMTIRFMNRVNLN